MEQLTLVPRSPSPIGCITGHSPAEVWSIQLSGRVSVENRPPYRRIYVDHKLHMQYVLRKKSPDERMAIVLLVERDIMTQRQVADAFGVHYNTVNNWIRDYRRDGMRGLIPAYHSQTLPPASEVICPPSEPVKDDVHQELLPLALELDISDTETGEPTVEPQVATVSRYVGLLLIVPFLQAMLQPLFKYLKHTGRRFHSEDKMWKVWDLLQAWALMIFQGVHNPEQSKALVHRELGVLFGRRRFLSCESLRRSWPLLVSYCLPSLSGKYLARQLIKLGYVSLGTLYLDGHFRPYFGKLKLGKGWWPQRRSGHRGFYQHWANDKQGLPIFCLMHQGYQYFGDIIPEMVDWLREQMQALSIEVPLIFVFDRGAFCGPLFDLLDRMKVGWITYRKGSLQYPEEDFTHCMVVQHEAGTQRKVEYCHKVVTLDSYSKKSIWALALRDADTGVQITLICNDDVIREITGRTMTDEEKIISVTTRWKQENFFKESKVHEDIDGVLGYQATRLRPDTELVPNPEYARQVAAVEAIEATVQRLKQACEAIAKRYEALKCKPSWTRFIEQRNNQKTLARYEAATHQLAVAREQLVATPEKVPFGELDEKQYQQMLFQRQQVLMTLRIAVFHARAQLRRLVEKHHGDYREVNKVVSRLVHGGGTYTTGVTKDIVTLTRPEQPRFQRTAELVIEELNAMKPKALGDDNKELVFRLADSV